MSALKQQTKNSRWDRKPKRDKDGKAIVAHITDRDVAIFRLLANYPLLSTDFILALLGSGDYQSLYKRLSLLKRKPNFYLYLPKEQRENADANYRSSIWKLDGRGEDECRTHGIEMRNPGHISNFPHKLMECQIAASIELGAIERGIQVIGWDAIQASDKFPAETRRTKNPLRIRYGNEDDDVVHPDWEPFVVVRQGEDTTKYSFCLLEADNNSETEVSRNRAKKNTIERKLEGYVKIIERRVHTSHFGASTLQVLFVTCSELRMKNMMRLLEQIIAEQGAQQSIAKRFLFKTVPSFTAHKEVMQATGHMLTEPWQRAGGFGEYRLDA